MLRRDFPVIERRSLIHLLDSLVGILAFTIEDISKASWHLSVMVLDYVHVKYRSETRKVFSQSVLCRALRYACNINVAIVLRLNPVAILINDLFLLSVATFRLIVLRFLIFVIEHHL